jgi:long-chain acyl-CoA synthetase
MKAILVPQFSPKIYISYLIKHKPNIIAGVPTLFEALMRDPKIDKVDFSKLKGAYSGGDSLPAPVKHRFDAVLAKGGSKTQLKEGYGLTETVTACMISPDEYREGSMGIPLPNTLAKVVRPGTMTELPPGKEGEICITGPQVMLGYLGDPQATKRTLKKHHDGRMWIHSGDMGTMDENGYFFFSGRYKRVLKVSGMSVFPEQVEAILETHRYVQRSCVIGVPDAYQMTSIKAFIVLTEEADEDDLSRVEQELIHHCLGHLMKWSVPKKFEFRKTLPTTLVGKVAFTQLEKQEKEKQ